MISMRQVWRALPRPNPIKCAYGMVFKCFLPIFPTLLWPLGGPHDAHDADDAGSCGAAGRLTCAINPDKTLTTHTVGSVCGSMPLLMPFLGFLTPPGLNQAKMGSQNCADDVSVRCARARPVQEHHQHNWDPILGRFELNQREQRIRKDTM